MGITPNSLILARTAGVYEGMRVRVGTWRRKKMRDLCIQKFGQPPGIRNSV